MQFARHLWQLADRLLAGFIAASLLWTLSADAAAAPPKAPKSKKRSGAGQQELYGLSWHNSVEGALREAAAGSPAKPVFWLRMLGDLGGFS
ncbi:MAG: hypothetical protein ACM3U2_19430 [Deltaproteobacteria bacterium]